MFSLGIDPSITNTNGASSSSLIAWRNGSRNSSPPRVGDSTLLCRWTLGMPGIAPSRTSSIPACPAAVIETESPSQLMPSEIHRMWTSSTAGAFGSVAISHSPRRQGLLELERVDEQLLAALELDVKAPAVRTLQRKVGHHRPLPAGPAASGGRDLLDLQGGVLEHRPLAHELEGERQRVGHHLAQVPDLQLDLRHPPRAGMGAADAHDGLGDGELVHPDLSRSSARDRRRACRAPAGR